MRKLKLNQFAIGFLAILSLFASSVAACCCSHSQPKIEAEVPSCHQQKPKDKNENPPNENSSKPGQTAADVPCGCFMQSAPRFFGKSETVKVEKQLMKSAAASETDFGFVSARAPAQDAFVFSPFRAANAFHRLKSPRAPPRA